MWVVDRTGDSPRVREVEITPRRYVGDLVEISAGLDPTQPVVVRGNEVLTQDQAVRVVGTGGR